MGTVDSEQKVGTHDGKNLCSFIIGGRRPSCPPCLPRGCFSLGPHWPSCPSCPRLCCCPSSCPWLRLCCCPSSCPWLRLCCPSSCPCLRLCCRTCPYCRNLSPRTHPRWTRSSPYHPRGCWSQNCPSGHPSCPNWAHLYPTR